MADTPAKLVFWQTLTQDGSARLVFGENSTAPQPTGTTRVFNGTTWLVAVVKRWDGVTWAPAVMRGRGESTWHAGGA